MRKRLHPVASFLLTFTGVSLVYALVAIVAVLVTFTLSGIQFTEKETADATLFTLALFFALLTLWIARYFRRSGRPASAAGAATASLIAIVAFLLFGWHFFSDLRGSSFEQGKWQRASFKPFGMAKTLMRDQKLVGLSRRELILKLGLGNEGNRDGKGDLFIYITDEDNWQLRFFLENERVKEVDLWQPGYDG
jgi:hypothetical protein